MELNSKLELMALLTKGSRAEISFAASIAISNQAVAVELEVLEGMTAAAILELEVLDLLPQSLELP
jgi:hypothetical protein